jgi:hypothetical protein
VHAGVAQLVVRFVHSCGLSLTWFLNAEQSSGTRNTGLVKRVSILLVDQSLYPQGLAEGRAVEGAGREDQAKRALGNAPPKF